MRLASNMYDLPGSVGDAQRPLQSTTQDATGHHHQRAILLLCACDGRRRRSSRWESISLERSFPMPAPRLAPRHRAALALAAFPFLHHMSASLNTAGKLQLL